MRRSSDAKHRVARTQRLKVKVLTKKQKQQQQQYKPAGSGYSSCQPSVEQYQPSAPSQQQQQQPPTRYAVDISGGAQQQQQQPSYDYDESMTAAYGGEGYADTAQMSDADISAPYGSDPYGEVRAARDAGMSEADILARREMLERDTLVGFLSRNGFQVRDYKCCCCHVSGPQRSSN